MSAIEVLTSLFFHPDEIRFANVKLIFIPSQKKKQNNDRTLTQPEEETDLDLLLALLLLLLLTERDLTASVLLLDLL